MVFGVVATNFVAFLNMFMFVYVKKAKLSERALELLALPNDGVPRLLLDIG